MSKIKHKVLSTLDLFLGDLNRDLRLILLANFVGAFGDGLYFYILPLYIRSLGGGPVEVGIFFSLLCLSAAITPIPGAGMHYIRGLNSSKMWKADFSDTYARMRSITGRSPQFIRYI